MCMSYAYINSIVICHWLTTGNEQEALGFNTLPTSWPAQPKVGPSTLHWSSTPEKPKAGGRPQGEASACLSNLCIHSAFWAVHGVQILQSQPLCGGKQKKVLLNESALSSNPGSASYCVISSVLLDSILQMLHLKQWNNNKSSQDCPEGYKRESK